MAPYRLVNIGILRISLKNFIASIEKATGLKRKKMMPMQPGDVTATWADGTLLNDLTGFTPNTDLDLGLVFVDCIDYSTTLIKRYAIRKTKS